MLLAQVTQVVADAPWWGPYLLGGTGVVVGALLTQVATFFNDKRKIRADKDKQRTERLLDSLGEFMAACEAAGHAKTLSQHDIKKIESEIESINLGTPDFDEKLSALSDRVSTDMEETAMVHRNELANVTKTYAKLATTASPKTLGYAAALYGVSKVLAFNQSDTTLRDHFSFLLHALPHVAREEIGLKNEINQPIPKELKGITDYSSSLFSSAQTEDNEDTAP